MSVLKAVLGIDPKPLLDGVERAKGAVGALKTQLVSVAEFAKISDALKVLGVSFGAFKGVEGAGEAFKGIFEAGKELRASSRATGESITTLITLRKAYQEVGMDAGSLQGNLTMLRAALGGVNAEGEPTKAIFDQLGLSVEKLKGLNAVEQFKAIGEAFSHLATQEDKVAAVRAIFGRAGGDMLNILGDPKAIEEAAKVTAEKAAVYEKNAALFTKVTNEFEAVGQKTTGFFLGASSSAARELSPALEEIKKIDTIAMGERFGKSLGNAVVNFKKDFATSMSEVIGLTAQLTAIAFSPSVLKPLSLELTSIASKFGDELQKAITGAKPKETQQQTIDRNLSSGSLLGAIQGGIGQVKTWGSGVIESGIESVMQGLGEAQSKADKSNPGMSPLDLQQWHSSQWGGDLRGFKTGSIKENITALRNQSIDQQGNDARAALGNPGRDFVNEVGKRISEALRTSPIFKGDGVSGTREEEDRKSYLKKYSLAGIDTKGPNVKSMDSHPATDRLAKIGGLIAGGSRDMDQARRSADATEKVMTMVQTMINSGIKVVTPDHSGGDAYA